MSKLSVLFSKNNDTLKKMEEKKKDKELRIQVKEHKRQENQERIKKTFMVNR
jgi:hypothetical protein